MSKTTKSATSHYAKTAKAGRATYIGQAVNMLIAKHVTRAEIKEATGMTRTLSSWDMNQLALAYGYKVSKLENKDGVPVYRLV